MADPVTALTPATAADFAGTVALNSNRSPDDPTVLLDGLPLVRFTALKQRALDLHGSIPAFEDVRQARLTMQGHANRISALTKHRSEGGFGLPEDAPQVVLESKKLERAKQELVRLETLKEVRTARWNAAGGLDRSVGDWVMRGIPANCVLEPVEDAPLSELLTKADGNRVELAVERCRLRLRELAADRHRVNSSPWPSSVAKAAAKELIERLADAAAPNLDSAIEHGAPISFATTRLTSQVYNVNNSPGAIAYAEAPDAIGLIAWMLRDQLLAKINAEFDQISDDKNALSAAQREEALAEINQSALAIERAECSLIWHADAAGETIDFRNDTTPQAVLGVRLITAPRADVPGTSRMQAWDILRP
jgi:hypothetical protein